MAAKVEGLGTVLKNLAREIQAIEDRTVGGLMAAGLIVQATAQRRVPVERGNLRASAFTRKSPTDPTAVEVGFSAAYALWVHENMEMKLKGQPRPSGLGVYWGPAGQPKFLESALIDEQQTIVNTVAAYAKAKGQRAAE